MKERAGRLFVVGTPIGNLGDITLRALEILKGVDVIITENKKRTLKLLNFYGIKRHLISINSYNEEKKIDSILRLLKEGKDCALLSSAGTPGISDPGRILVCSCLKDGVEVKSLPGPSAVNAGISISGISSERFLFYGFLPQKKSRKKNVLKELSQCPYAIVFFESPRKLLETLEMMNLHFCERRVIVLKEMTKIHEKIIGGTFEEIKERLKAEKISGEYTIILDKKERKE